MLATIREFDSPKMSIAIKRTIDILVAAAGLMVFAPVLAAVAVLVRLNLGPPVLFRQWRPGKDGRPFLLVKFRSMKVAQTDTAPQSPDSDRLTGFGRLLRSSTLDELPELWNVLKGDMSLVGPRPLLIEYLPLYSPFQARRHEVRPGLTGLAQVSGRNLLGWKERFELDVWYVDNWTLSLDFKIMLLTVQKVLNREGITAGGESTVSRFTGTP